MYSKPLLIAVAAAAVVAVARAQTSAFEDPNTGITFQRYLDTVDDLAFGLALPENPTTDLIGQLVFRLTKNDTGWGGMALGPSMVNTLLLVAFADRSTVMPSLRSTPSYLSPPLYPDSSVTVSPIPSGTFVNSTHVSYTFLCSGCGGGTGMLIDITKPTAEVGYAYCPSNPTDLTNAGTILPDHTNAATISMNLQAACSSDFSTWAAMAGNSSSNNQPSTTGSRSSSRSPSTTGSGGGGGHSRTTGSGGGGGGASTTGSGGGGGGGCPASYSSSVSNSAQLPWSMSSMPPMTTGGGSGNSMPPPPVSTSGSTSNYVPPPTMSLSAQTGQFSISLSGGCSTTSCRSKRFAAAAAALAAGLALAAVEVMQ